MTELHPLVLEAIEQLEATWEAREDRDLTLLREYFEGVLPGRDGRRITARLMSDSEFSRLALPVLLATIEAGRGRQRLWLWP